MRAHKFTLAQKMTFCPALRQHANSGEVFVGRASAVRSGWPAPIPDQERDGRHGRV